MALPKEPRQKMINIMYLVLTAILALNVSAEILEAFKTVDNSLQGSTKNISNANNTIYASLNEKLNEAESRAKAEIWAPKAEQAKKYAAELDAYIEGLKQELKKESGLEMKIKDGKSVEDFKEDDLDASTRMFETNKKGEELKKKLDEFKKNMLGIDSSIKREFESTFPVSTEDVQGQEGKKDFTTGYFHMTPTVAALTILSKFQNNVKNAENSIANYCHNQIGKVKVIFDKAAVLVGQSSNYVMPGQEIEITAGVGSYSSVASPSISIGGVGVSATNGVGSYKFQAGGSGKQSKTVTVSYKDQNGQTQTESRTVEYTVGVPGGAAVMLDKMNVFYIGVPNPVTISSGSGWDKTSVSMSGGSISGSGSNRIVTVSSVGKASISVTADGKTSNFEFRVKEIPNPIFKVGPGGTRMSAATFKNQQFCRADLENFDFAANFDVLSAKVYFSGAGFPGGTQTTSIGGPNLSSLSALMQRCGPGSAITFDDVKVKGPDGKQRTIQGVGISLF